jgi:hypothetical protein
LASVTNSRGRTAAAPCDAWCGPLDISAWYEAASHELSELQRSRSGMSDLQRSRADRLLADYRALPPRVAWAAIDRDATTAAAANVAQAAADLRNEVSRPAPGGAAPGAVPPGPAPAPGGDAGSGGGWSWPSLPGVDLPELSLPTFDFAALFRSLGPWAIGALLVYLLAITPRGRR